MQAYQSNLAAMNAARKFMREQGMAGDWKEHFVIEKLAVREWIVQHKQPIDRSNAWESLALSYEGAFEFPTARRVAALRAFFNSRRSPEIESDDSENELAEAERQAERIANAQASESTLPNGKLWIRQSSILKPVKMVHAIADEMIAANPNVTRKEVQAECERRGIASGTARTQYQAWKQARDNAKLNADHAASLSRKLNGQ